MTSKIGILYRKELVDIIRDRKTLMLMILLPVLLYPLLMIGGLFLTSSVISGPKNPSYVIAAKSEDLSKVSKVIREYDGNAELTVVDVDLYEKTPDLIVEFGEQEDGKTLITLSYDSSENNSSSANSTFSSILTDYEKALSRKTLEEQGLDAELILNPIELKKEDTASKEQRAGFVIGMVLPFMLITSILMGALYPAIDTTAGEKERGTLETLMTLPITNYELITGKFLAVATVSVCSALLNILSMGVCTFFLYFSAMDSMALLAGKSEDELSVASFGMPAFLTLICALSFAVFISALVLCVCLNTSSFKEAENISTPVILLVIVSSVVSVIPTFELTTATALIPVINTALLIRDVFSFKLDPTVAAVVIGANLSYTALIVILIGKMYRSEQVLFGKREGRESVKFFHKRSEIEAVPGKMPGTGDAVILLIACFLAMMTVGSFLQIAFPSFGILANQVIFAGFSLFMAWYMKCDIKKLFSFLKPKGNIFLAILSSVLLWAGTYLIMLCMIEPLENLFPSSQENLGLLEYYMEEMSPFMLILGVGIAPAICEELLFRGFIFGTVKERYGKIPAVIISALLFGIYHMSLPRFFTTGTIGFVQGCVLASGGSIFLTMLMHGINNTISVMGYVCPEWIVAHANFLVTGFRGVSEVLPALGLAALLLGAGAGVMALNLKIEKKKTEKN